jgi:hypothetical protein
MEQEVKRPRKLIEFDDKRLVGGGGAGDDGHVTRARRNSCTEGKTNVSRRVIKGL